MTFTIPNKAVTYPFQSRIFQSDFDILGATVGSRYGVIDPGCEVTETSPTPAMTVDVASGQVVIGYELVDIASQTVGLEDADALLPRFDTIAAFDDGTVTSITGTPDAAPFPLSPTSDAVGLAQVFVPAADTAIQTAQIVDKRVFVPSPIAPSEWTLLSASTDLARSSSAVATIDPALSFTMNANAAYRIRFQLLFTASVASSGGLRFGVFGPTAPTVWGGTYNAFANQFSGGATQFTQANLNSTAGQTTYGNSFTVVPVITIGGDIIFVNGSNSGTFGIAWGQNAASANAMSRKKGSYLEYELAG